MNKLKKLRMIIAIVLATALLAACAQTPAPAPPTPTVPQAGDTPAATTTTETTAPAANNPGETVFGQLPGTLPRHETLFFGGQQWGTPISNSPFALTPNNSMVMDLGAANGGRFIVYEALYMFNQLDGQLYPLLAGGPYSWDDDMTVLTVPLNPDAHFNNGTPFTSRDVIATFEMHLAVGTGQGLQYAPFIDEIVAVNDHTIEIHLNMDNYNPLRILEWIARTLMLSADFMDEKLTQHGGDLEAFRNDPWESPVHTGAYHPVFLSSTMVVLERDDNYWGQAPSMWGRLPAPRFLVHNIYGSNDAIRASFAQGQIDINQQFITNVWELWEAGVPISTFLPNPPFYIPGTMPSIFFNTTRPGLDQTAVRQAIAFAIDYDQIITAAMSGYSPNFRDAPRSISLPLDGEQRFVDNAALADLQWGNQDIERANQILDDAGIVDTDGDGIREWNGENLSFTLMCPMGWNDWEASLEIVASAGLAIGIQLSTNFVETVVWSEAQQTGDFDILMAGAAGTSISSPWNRAFEGLFVEDPNAERMFWAWHRLYNPEINDLILRAGAESDEVLLREYFTEISRFLLTEMPFVALMYRPLMFHTVNESIWSGFPEQGDGTNIPPMMLTDGYGLAGLFNIFPIN
ncbi:MAG: ABC transporter substrate-binding protein [Firmicutes bacterium]|nr:ABC transporter substrate-binding protein [Bacillota bacterium]